MDRTEQGQSENLRRANPSSASAGEKEKISKKEQIISLFVSGITDVEDLSAIIRVRPSYVGTVLQEAGLVKDYFDLYTSTSHPMNIYSNFLRGNWDSKTKRLPRAEWRL